MKKLIVLATFLVGGSLSLFVLTLLGCGKREVNVLFKDIAAEVVRYDSDGFDTMAAENDTCNASDFSLSLTFDVTHLALNEPVLAGNTARAFKPGPQHSKPVEKLTSLRIIPLRPFNNNFPAGTDMSPSCNFTMLHEDIEVRDSSAATILESLNRGYYSDFGLGVPVIRVYFSEKPATLSGQQFAVELKTETGAMIRDTTVFFYLKP